MAPLCRGILLIAACAWTLRADRPFVNKRAKEHPVSLTPGHFRRAKNPPPDQKPNMAKIVRKDLIEGDIAGYTTTTMRDAIMSAKSRGFFVQRSAVRDRYNLWPNGIIPYVVSSNYFEIGKYKLAAALADFHQNTCIRFVPRSKEENYLYIRPDDGCYSSVGRTGGQQTVSLDEGCFQHGTIVHELMHTVGIFHEQNRNDRDSYVSIRWENIERGLENNFEKRSLATIDHLGTPYDYSSVMHYGNDYFSRNGLPTVVPFKQGIFHKLFNGITIGQRDGFSYYDVQRVNLLYHCDGKKPPTRPNPRTRPPAPPPVVPPPPPPRPPHPPPPIGPHGPSPPGPRGGACYRKIPGAPIMIKIKRGCFRVVKYNGKITVASCDFRAQTTKMTTERQETAREEARYLQSLGMRQCYSEGLRRRLAPRGDPHEATQSQRPELYAHETHLRPDWRFDRIRRPNPSGPRHVNRQRSRRRGRS